MIPLGQFRDTFIIAVDDEGIAIIDQHVAHERVLFEQVMERLTAGRLESQRLLEPMLIELPRRAQAPGAGAHAASSSVSGFEVEEFGGDASVSAVPALLEPRNARRLRALAEDLEGLDRGSRVEDALRRIAATMACHAAVKANYPLTLEKMAHIATSCDGIGTPHRRRSAAVGGDRGDSLRPSSLRSRKDFAGDRFVTRFCLWRVDALRRPICVPSLGQIVAAVSRVSRLFPSNNASEPRSSISL